MKDVRSFVRLAESAPTVPRQTAVLAYTAASVTIARWISSDFAIIVLPAVIA